MIHVCVYKVIPRPPTIKAIQGGTLRKHYLLNKMEFLKFKKSRGNQEKENREINEQEKYNRTEVKWLI